MSTATVHKVFVYGTLKKGEPNHFWFSKSSEGFCKYLCDAKTKEKFPLIIATEYNIPFLLHSPGNGYQVKGEVYEVDDKVMADLDDLEGYPGFYARDIYDVIPLDGPESTMKVWIYLIKNYKEKLLKEHFYESYSDSGSHGKRYVVSENASLEDLNLYNSMVVAISCISQV
nr:putative gamma-glutamylcyclotransferase CG2811 isoform X1 [Leptinotarsa decemlineata]XP_023030272.1 putative gamma-glutamylcyclotransferase CG2811 isoform X1 [Leptinotarsa decemlineata]